MVFPVIGGDGKPTGYEISNSARFQPNDYVSRYDGVGDESSNAGKIGTVSLWTKRGDLGRAQGLFVVYEHNGQGYQTIWFNSDDTLQLAYEISGTEYQIKTNAKFRDPSAWYHVVAMTDTTQGTDSNRMKIYVNGTEQSYGSTAYPPQNTTLLWGKGSSTSYQYRIGNKRGVGSTTYSNYNGHIAEVHLCMGQNYTPSEFGETNDNGVWIPKEADVSYGTNGGYYEFKQTGTSANASGIGADTSGTGNHAGVGGLDATNITEDTPTNNFATFNSLHKASNVTLSEANCKAAIAGAGQSRSVTATIAVSKGKWYWETKYTTDVVSCFFGLVSADIAWNINATDYPSSGVSDNVGFNDGGTKYVNGTSSSYHSGGAGTVSDGDIVGCAANLDDDEVVFYVNGTALNSGTAIDKTFSGDYFFVVQHQSSSGTSNFEVNFGNPTFSISSGNADANGYGNFEYAPPSGFYAVCTKNLAKYG